MNSSALRARLQGEDGFSLVELIVTTVILGIVMGGLVNIFVSGERASADATARMTSQQGVRTAFDRLEYDVRCASKASILSSGAGVYLTLPSQCAHSTGTATWCVSSGSLIRNTGTTCAATTHRITYIKSVTSATPFACYSPVTPSLPQLRVILTVNSSTRNANKTTTTDYITMHNVPATYNSGSALTLPAATITVANASGFPSSGTLSTANGVITYTGTTSTTFTGSTGGTGSLAANAALVSTGCS
jgi:prepilin-type N-terminal cleavage/methylation domain-containing protein